MGSENLGRVGSRINKLPNAILGSAQRKRRATAHVAGHTLGSIAESIDENNSARTTSHQSGRRAGRAAGFRIRVPGHSKLCYAASRARRAQLSIRHGDRNYDRDIAGLGAGYFASDFDWLSSRLFDANGIAAVSRWRLAPRHCRRLASTAMQYWTDEGELHEVARITSTS